MRLQLTLLQFTAICLAEQQQPLGDKLKGWFDKAASYIPTSVPNVPNPVNAASAKVAELAVTPLNKDNWKETIKAGPPSTTGEPDEWLVYISGGNKTCYGLCERADLAWNASVARLSTTPKSPKLASIDCEKENILCIQWGANPPSLYHVLLPHAPGAEPVARYVSLNSSGVTAAEITELHTKRGFESVAPYTGIWNPFNGIFAKLGVSLPVAYILHLFAKMPSWLPMVLVSLLSRRLMGRTGPRAAGRPVDARAAAGEGVPAGRATKPAARKA